MRKLPFTTICAHEKSIESHIRIRIGHPIAVVGVMGFPMFAQYRLELELSPAAFEGANILDVSIFFVFAHQCFAFKRFLALFHRAKTLKRKHKNRILESFIFASEARYVLAFNKYEKNKLVSLAKWAFQTISRDLASKLIENLVGNEASKCLCQNNFWFVNSLLLATAVWNALLVSACKKAALAC